MWPSKLIFLSKLIFCKNLYFCQNWHFCQNWYFCQNLYLCQIITFDIFINRFWYNYQHLIFISIIDISINCLLEYQLVVPVNCNFAHSRFRSQFFNFLNSLLIPATLYDWSNQMWSNVRCATFGLVKV